MSSRFIPVLALSLGLSLGLVAIRPVLAQDPPKSPDAPKAVEVADYKKLKELLPESVGELKRTNAEGGKQSIGEMKLSQAKGTYNVDDKEESATVTILDYGAMPGMAEGVAVWAKADIDNDSDTDYTRTIEVQGCKGLETYNKESKSGTLTLLVANRFIVTIEINALSSDTLKKTAEAMKLKDLEALAK